MNHQLSAATSTAAAPTISSACPTYSFCSPRSTGCHSRKQPKWDSRKALDRAVSMPKTSAACSASSISASQSCWRSESRKRKAREGAGSVVMANSLRPGWPAHEQGPRHRPVHAPRGAAHAAALAGAGRAGQPGARQPVRAAAGDRGERCGCRPASWRQACGSPWCSCCACTSRAAWRASSTTRASSCCSRSPCRAPGTSSASCSASAAAAVPCVAGLACAAPGGWPARPTRGSAAVGHLARLRAAAGRRADAVLCPHLRADHAGGQLRCRILSARAQHRGDPPDLGVGAVAAPRVDPACAGLDGGRAWRCCCRI